ncbi:hypothetical protein BDW74DRAFT_181769 [Aspergillus multicolor]|uniref:uncharacterized protein n=1 Tax=Aspergillus multicolor TaxID=41759 RepID=UPI003CCD2FE7
MEGLGAAASVIAVVDLAGKVATVLFRYLTAVKHAKPDIERLCNELDQLTATLQNAQRLLNGPKAAQLQTANSQPLRQALNGSYLELVSLEGKLTKKLESNSSRVMSKFGIRGLKWPFESKDVDRIITALERQRDTLSTALIIDQVEQTFNIDQTLVLSKLPVVEDALFDSQANEHESRCHPDTRVDLLQDIYRWVDSTDPASKSVFYLQGMADTGKSTISRTVAQHLVQRPDPPLVATFFFKRGEGDRGNASRVITTLTSQLIAKEPILAANVKLAIDANHAIASKPMDEQFGQLILVPLGKLDSKARKSKAVIVIIDALDECGEEDDIRRLVYQISRGAALDSIQWKAFLTGRSELPVRLGIDVIRGNVEQRQLELVPEADIHHDLTSFFTTRFANIRDDFNRLCHDDSRLPQGWPGNGVTQQLVHRAIPLFIFAATVCRFIEDRAWSDPRAQLGKILHHATAFAEMDNLEATYLPILSQLVVPSKVAQQRLYSEFSNVVGSIVILTEPLSANSLSRVLGLPRSIIDRRLMTMHSVLRVPDSPDVPIKMLHLSFRDFLTDPEKRQQNPFWIDAKAVQAKLADSCLDFLSSQNHLRKDICGLGSPGVCQADIPITVINSCLPANIRYACLYWVHHTEQSGVRLTDEHRVYTFLTKHLLHWLEALGLLGRLSDSISMIQGLRGLVVVRSNLLVEGAAVSHDSIQQDSSARLSALLDDIFRFILAFQSIIKLTPLQAYSSALIFAPQKTLVRQTFKHHIPQWLTMVPGSEAPDWGPLVQTIKAGGNLETLVFSPNGKTIARSNRHAIQLWDSTTGDTQLKIPTLDVEKFAFSPDSKILASVYAANIALWDTATGEKLREMEDIACINARVVFSPDSQRLVCCSSRGIHVFQVSTSEENMLVEVYDLDMQDIAFLSDRETVLILRGHSKPGFNILLISTTTGSQHELDRGEVGATITALSPNGATIAWVGADQTVSLQDIGTGMISHKLASPAKPVKKLILSYDGELLAFIDKALDVQIWNTITGGQLFACSKKHIMNVAFSPGGRLVGMVGGLSKWVVVDIWDIKSKDYHSTTKLTQDTYDHGSQNNEMQERGHTHSVRKVIFSPNGKTVASVGLDNRVCTWDPRTGERFRKFCHQHHIHKIFYLPDSNSIVSLSGNSMILIWDLLSTNHRQLVHQGREIGDIAVSPDGQTLASVHCDVIRLWNLPGSECLHDVGYCLASRVAELSPNSKTLAVVSDSALGVWDVSTGEEKWELEAPIVGARPPLAFSLDSTSVATMAARPGVPSDERKGEIVVCDVGSGKKHELPHHPVSCYEAVALSADGRIVAAYSSEPEGDFIVLLTSTRSRKVQIHSCIQSMSFSVDERFLETNRGLLRVDDDDDDDDSGHQDPKLPSPTTYTIPPAFVSLDWIWQGGNKLLCIPHSHRRFACARYGDIFVLGCQTGQMIFMRLGSD